MQTYKELLKQFISLRSISTDPKYLSEIAKTAEWLKHLFTERGFKVNLVEGFDNPILVASYETDPSYKTCLIYGHYDVQPAAQEEGWESDPFELTERNGRFYARGAIDNKGQVLIHIATVFDLIESGQLGYNVKFMIEGNEETGSPSMPRFIAENAQILKADFAMISDGEVTAGQPTLELGFRGGFNSTLTVRTSTTDLHSGLYGGAVPSSSTVLAKFLASLHTPEGSISIPNFYDDVDPVTDEMLEDSAKIPFELEEYKKLSGTNKLLTEKGYDFYSQTGLRPAIIVTGIESGYMGVGYRNSVPASSRAKINFRLVKNQKPEQIAELFRRYTKENMPSYADYELEITDPYEGIKLDIANEYVEKARVCLSQAYHAEVLMKYCGGGLPIVTLFNDALGIPQVLAPLANEDCAMHAANENFELGHLEKALEFSKAFLKL